MKPKKICIVSTIIPPDYTGAGLRAYNHAKYLSHIGIQVNIITTTKSYEKLNNIRINTIRLPNFFFKNKLVVLFFMPRLFIIFLNLLKNIKPDFVHCFGFESWFSILFLFTCRLRKIKAIVETTLIGLDDPLTIKRSQFGKLKFNIFSHANKVINLSPSGTLSCKSAKIQDEKLVLIPNSVDTRVFHPVNIENKIALRRKYNIDSERKVFISVGAVIPRKGIKDIIEIYSNVLWYFKKSYLIIVGPVDINIENISYYNKMQEYINNIGIRDNVIFTGRISNVDEWFQIADICLFASTKEGFPSVIIQAMATGVPVVSLPLPNVIDYIISDQENGIISQNIDEAVKDIIDLLSYEDKYKKISSNSINTVLTKYTDDIIMNSYINLYSTI